jgi:hypothetical protein
MLSNNWKYWGPKGLFITHGLFEHGVAVIMKPLTLTHAMPSIQDINNLHKIGPVEWFKHAARRIAGLDLYERFYEQGWTPRLASAVRKELAPEVVKAVCLFWYSALSESGNFKLQSAD